MVEARDIMIGNLILQKEIKIDEYLTENPKIVKVDSIYFDALLPNVYLINGYPSDFYDPILLTEDWLLRFNFSYSYKFDEWLQYGDHSGLSLLRNYDNGHWYIDSSTVNYVHEFQNFLKIKGVDITDLF